MYVVNYIWGVYGSQPELGYTPPNLNSHITGPFSEIRDIYKEGETNPSTTTNISSGSIFSYSMKLLMQPFKKNHKAFLSAFSN